MTWMVLFFFFALLNWTSVEFRWRQIELVSKPLALLMQVLCFWQVLGWQGAAIWFGLGLVFSLLGDIILLWPKRFFLPGLVTFLTAHICYIFGLNQDAVPLQGWSVIFLILVTGVGYSAYRTILKGLQRKPQNLRLRWPMLLYCLVITLMMLSAWLCILRPEWSTAAGWLVAVGATLFIASDTLLAYGLFVDPIEHGDFWVMLTYHLGQAGLLAGIILRVLG